MIVVPLRLVENDASMLMIRSEAEPAATLVFRITSRFIFGVGMTIVFVVGAVAGILRSFSFSGPLFANSFPELGLDTGGIPSNLLAALLSALSGLISVLPIGVLAGVLAWYWLSQHPAKHQVSGMLDEV